MHWPTPTHPRPRTSICPLRPSSSHSAPGIADGPVHGLPKISQWLNRRSSSGTGPGSSFDAGELTWSIHALFRKLRRRVPHDGSRLVRCTLRRHSGGRPRSRNHPEKSARRCQSPYVCSWAASTSLLECTLRPLVEF